MLEYKINDNKEHDNLIRDNVIREIIESRDWWSSRATYFREKFYRQYRYNLILVLVILVLISSISVVLLTQEVRIGDVCLSCWGK